VISADAMVIAMLRRQLDEAHSDIVALHYELQRVQAVLLRLLLAAAEKRELIAYAEASADRRPS